MPTPTPIHPDAIDIDANDKSAIGVVSGTIGNATEEERERSKDQQEEQRQQRFQ